jgi:hypothetical protein
MASRWTNEKGLQIFADAQHGLDGVAVLGRGNGLVDDAEVVELQEAVEGKSAAWYSLISLGIETGDEGAPCILEADKSSKEYWETWARLIQKIYEVDPLTWAECQGVIRIVRFVKDWEVIKAILKHLGQWLAKSRPTPKVHARPLTKDRLCSYA